MADARKFKSKFPKYSPEWLKALRLWMAGDGATKPVPQRAAAKKIRMSGAAWGQWETGDTKPDSCRELLLDLLANGTLK